MPWICAVCTLKNLEDSSNICDLCSSSKGSPDPDASLTPKARIQSKRESLVSRLPLDDAKLHKPQKPPPMKRGVFGVPLNSSCPRVLCDCMAYIEANGLATEGLFRIPGSSDTVESLKALYEKNEDSDVLGTCGMVLEIHDVGTLMKLYFRVLPEPLLPADSYDELMETLRTEDQSKEELVEGVMAVLRRVPSPQRECFGLIIKFLKQVTQLEQQNKMTPANLATCFAPSLLRAPDRTSAQEAFLDMSAAIGALNILIRHPENLPLPSEEEIEANTRYHKVRDNTRSPGNSVTGPPPGMSEKSNVKSPAGPPPGMDRPPGFD